MHRSLPQPNILLAILFLFYATFSPAQTDTSRKLLVHFLYGSKPKRGHKHQETKVFGGLHGGHVSIQVDSIDYGFEPSGKPVHIFPRKKFKSDFVDQVVLGEHRYSTGNKTVSFIIPISQQQYLNICQLHKTYCEKSPYDYAFFGMRCAAATREILAEIGILHKQSRFRTVCGTFYPKRLRKKMFRLAAQNHYSIITQAGRPSRRWEKD